MRDAAPSAGPPEVVIRYTRLPDRVTEFRQSLVARSGDCVVTLMQATPLRAPVLAGERVILEPGAPVVWFTFDGAWHDIGRFHTADCRFTGLYANVLTPVQAETPLQWATTDLCLDVFRHDTGAVEILDEAELEAALQAGWIEPALAARARTEAARIATGARNGTWPPAIVAEWTLARARAALR